MSNTLQKTEKVNRVLIAGTGSGCGKTTAAIALLQAFKNRGMTVSAAKCGPDYIDPMFHRSVIETPSTNLDSFFFDENTLRLLLAKHGANADITVIEGVMGYYDGLGLTSSKGSAYEIASLTNTPVILVVNARGASLSILAQIHGFLSFAENSRIMGVILNNCTERVYASLKVEVESRLGIRALGYLPKLEDAQLKSRHLGLITAEEVTDLKLKLKLLASQAETSIDLEGIIELARSAAELEYFPLFIEERERVRIAVARDRAFCFYYEDSLSLISDMGAEIVPFSPIEDAAIPNGVHGLYLGGGYPELYAAELSDNSSMRESIKSAVSAGLPTIAECGGFMYLTERIGALPAVGAINGGSFDSGRLQRFGYVSLTAKSDNLLCKAGEGIPAHEFHHWDAENCGNGFTAEKTDGRKWDCVHTTKTLYAGFPHFHFYANRGFAESFYNACLKRKNGEKNNV